MHEYLNKGENTEESTVELRLRPAGTNKLEGFQEVVLLSKMRVLFKKRVLFKSGS